MISLSRATLLVKHKMAGRESAVLYRQSCNSKGVAEACWKQAGNEVYPYGCLARAACVKIASRHFHNR
jgi:hypothetical protein